MDTELLLKIMAAFTVVAAVSLAITTAAVVGVWRSVNALRERSTEFMDQWQPVAQSSQETLTELRQQSKEVLEKAGELASTTQGQIDKVESLIDQFAETAQKNIARVDETMHKTLQRVDNTTAAVEQTLRAPADKLRAVGAGLHAAAQELLKSKRRDIDRIATDEEMFL